MDAIAKRRFIRELISNVQADILAKVDQMPDTWDGHELRRYVADKFEDASMTLGRDRSYRKRLRSYKNDVLVGNL